MKYGCKQCGRKICAEKTSNTKKSFIEKARKIHGDKYDYSKVEYVNAYTKICIICPEHGEFLQTPHDHLKGASCPKCGNIKRKEGRLLSTDKFIEKADKYVLFLFSIIRKSREFAFINNTVHIYGTNTVISLQCK